MNLAPGSAEGPGTGGDLAERLNEQDEDVELCEEDELKIPHLPQVEMVIEEVHPNRLQRKKIIGFPYTSCSTTGKGGVECQG